jgi:tetratricopeptide (TPR) repeat protein
MLALAGCAGTGSVVYRPEIRPDMTIPAAVQDLQNAARSGKFYEYEGPWSTARGVTNITVNEDGSSKWEFDPEPRRFKAVGMSLLTQGLDFAVNEWGPAGAIMFPNFKISGSLPDLKKAADNLYFIQKTLENLPEKLNKELALFEPIAAEYRSLRVKPQITEEQRRLVVQANAYNQRKDYAGAIDRYNKTLEHDPVSYPEAYFNLALLHEQQRLYTFAITYMKKYLMLVPDAEDARGAQDKIYEWEAWIQK